MKIVTYLEALSEFEIILSSQVKEVILSPASLSRLGKLSIDEACELASKCRQHGIKTTLEWDILMTNPSLESSIANIKKIDLGLFDSVRVQDAGALHYLVKSCSCKIQLVLENGNHNQLGIKSWIDFIGGRLERIVLSHELTGKVVSKFKKELKVPIEYLALGRILLFYTPRNLVSPIYKKEQNYIELSGSSEESPHRGFPIIENTHGTFMFNVKDLCLLDVWGELQDTRIDFARIDLRFQRPLGILKDIVQLNEKYSLDLAMKIKEQYQFPVIKGFFRVNKTDILFTKLKNDKIKRVDDFYVGEVIEVIKKNHIAIIVKSTKNSIKVGSSISIKTPDGKIKKAVVSFMKNSRLEEVVSLTAGQVVFINHISGVSIRSAVYIGQH